MKNSHQIKIEIDPDDDFALDIGRVLVIEGRSANEVREKAVSSLVNAKFTYVKTYGTKQEGEDWVRGDYSGAWCNIRDAAVKALLKRETYFRYGGNQTITYEITEKSSEKLVNCPHCKGTGKVAAPMPSQSKVIQQQIADFLKTGGEVKIFRQTEMRDEPPYAVVIASDPEFWLDCFGTREEAHHWCTENGLVVTE